MVAAVMILNCLKFDDVSVRKFKIKTTSITAHISSAFELCLILCKYLETKSSNLSYTKFSDP